MSSAFLIVRRAADVFHDSMNHRALSDCYKKRRHTSWVLPRVQHRTKFIYHRGSVNVIDISIDIYIDSSNNINIGLIGSFVFWGVHRDACGDPQAANINVREFFQLFLEI